MSRLYRPIAFALLLAATSTATAQAAPPWLEGFRAYRVVDASGRTVPRIDANGLGRSALRPTYPTNPLLRARPMYLSGYAGATYGPRRGYDPTSYHSHSHGHGIGGVPPLKTGGR